MAPYKPTSYYPTGGKPPAGQGDLSADDYNYFQQQRRNITNQYNLGKFQNRYERQQAGLNYNRQKRNLTQAWASRVPEFQQPYTERGLLNSGLYRQGYDQFRTARNMEIGDLTRAYDERMGALNLADWQLFDIYKWGQNDVSSAIAARRSTIAEELRRARQGL